MKGITIKFFTAVILIITGIGILTQTVDNGVIHFHILGFGMTYHRLTILGILWCFYFLFKCLKYMLSDRKIKHYVDNNPVPFSNVTEERK